MDMHALKSILESTSIKDLRVNRTHKRKSIHLKERRNARNNDNLKIRNINVNTMSAYNTPEPSRVKPAPILQNKQKTEQLQARVDKLKLWKENKDKQKLEQKRNAKPMFKVCHAKPVGNLDDIYSTIKGQKIVKTQSMASLIGAESYKFKPPKNIKPIQTTALMALPKRVTRSQKAVLSPMKDIGGRKVKKDVVKSAAEKKVPKSVKQGQTEVVAKKPGKAERNVPKSKESVTVSNKVLVEVKIEKKESRERRLSVQDLVECFESITCVRDEKTEFVKPKEAVIDNNNVKKVNKSSSKNTNAKTVTTKEKTTKEKTTKQTGTRSKTEKSVKASKADKTTKVESIPPKKDEKTTKIGSMESITSKSDGKNIKIDSIESITPKSDSKTRKIGSIESISDKTDSKTITKSESKKSRTPKANNNKTDNNQLEKENLHNNNKIVKSNYDCVVLIEKTVINYTGTNNQITNKTDNLDLEENNTVVTGNSILEETSDSLYKTVNSTVDFKTPNKTAGNDSTTCKSDNSFFMSPDYPMMARDKSQITPVEQMKRSIEAPPSYVSPFVTVSRGKNSARKEYKDRKTMGGTSNSPFLQKTTSVQASAEYFYKILNIEINKIKEQCDIWNEYRSTNDLEEEPCDMINTAVGQATLLINKKMQQFAGLIETSVEGNGEMLVTCEDLHGFWDIINLQIGNINNRFANLDSLKENNWVEILPEKKKKSPKKPIVKPVVKKATKATGKSNILRDAIKAARLREKGGNTETEESTTKVVEIPKTPRKSVSKTPQKPKSNRKSVNSAKNVVNKRVTDLYEENVTTPRFNVVTSSPKRMSPYIAMMQVTQAAKSVERNMDSNTPVKSILKLRNTQNSIRKSKAVLFKDDDEEISESSETEGNLSSEILKEINENVRRSVRIKLN